MTSLTQLLDLAVERPQTRIATASHQEQPNARGRPGGAWSALALLTLLFLLWIAYHYFLQPQWLDATSDPIRNLLMLLEVSGAFTLTLIWPVVWWRSQRREPSAGVLSRGEMYALSPAQFERYVANLFRRKGYRVQARGRSGDRGVDLVVVKPSGRRAIVQCKRYRRPVGPEIVRELFGTLIHEGASHAFLVTTGTISDGARAWASDKPMTLIDGASLLQAATAIARRTAQ